MFQTRPPSIFRQLAHLSPATAAVAVLPERSVKLPAQQQSLSFVIHLVTPGAIC